jgi:hypothetical protein
MSSGTQATVELDWGNATVEDGTLTLPFSDKASKRWVREVTSVLERLAPRAGVEVGREELTIAVEVGQEGDTRHLLESAVLEANSRLAIDEDAGDGDRDADDEAMTRAFRAFAPDR